jgi:adenylate cyclase
MAVYGIPYLQKNDAFQAVLTVIKMQECMRRFNEQRRFSGLESMKIIVGICTSEVIADNLKYKQRMDFAVIGEEVNISEYLEKLNKRYGTEILTSQSRWKEINGHFCTRLLNKVFV